jgi:hypothetical protein
MAKKSSEIRTIGDPANKKKRDARKEKREGIRTQKATELAKSQAVARGEDWESIGKARIVNPRIAETLLDIDEKTAKSKKEGAIKAPSDIEKFTSSYGKPVLEDVPTRSQKQLIAHARKQRQARFGDILTAVGRGMQRKGVDPDMLKGNRLRQEQEDEYKEFKDISERNKRAKTVWDNQVRLDTIASLEKKKAEEKDDKYKTDQIQIQLDKLKWEQSKYDLDKEGKKLDRESRERIAGIGATSREKLAKIKADKPVVDKTKDPAYILRKKQFLLDVRKQEGEEASEKLANTLKGFEAEITNLESEKYNLEQEQEEASRSDRDSFDPLIAEIDKKIAAANKNIETSLKGDITTTSQEKLDEFFK